MIFGTRETIAKYYQALYKGLILKIREYENGPNHELAKKYLEKLKGSKTSSRKFLFWRTLSLDDKLREEIISFNSGLSGIIQMGDFLNFVEKRV